MNRRRQRGFTLIELMVALVVSSLLAGMILAIFSRMSTAYRGQQQIAGLQQVLAAARATIELDARQAGLAMAQGFKLAGDASPPAPKPTKHSPISITNSNTGPDELALFYADPTSQAVVSDVVGAWTGTPAVTVDLAAADLAAAFLPGDLVVLSTADLTKDNPAGAHLATYDACVLQIVTPGGIAGSTVTFSTVAPWGVAGSAHCTTPTPGKTMMYRFVAHAYRIDPDPVRAAQGPLQWSLTGGLIGTAADGWTDLAYGFTDLQTALEVHDGDGVDTPDPDLDPDPDANGNRDWYSGEQQEAFTQPIAADALYAPPIELSISLVARTDRDVEGIATLETPDLIVPGNPDNNPIGDHPKVTLPWAIDPTLPGRIYRSTTFQVDLRNLGVGR